MRRQSRPRNGQNGRRSLHRDSRCGKAIHPSYVEGQYQGGAVQGIGWALNEEYVYSEDGVMENAGFGLPHSTRF